MHWIAPGHLSHYILYIYIYYSILYYSIPYCTILFSTDFNVIWDLSFEPEGWAVSYNSSFLCLNNWKTLTRLALPPPPLVLQVVFFLRTSPSWPQFAPSPASSPSCCPFTTSMESSSWAWRWDAHPSSCMRITLASRPRRTTLCFALSTLLTESMSRLIVITVVKHTQNHRKMRAKSHFKLG